ncbi:RNA recognition motif domain-containing protein [Thermodesulfobacteriota bacterium]
MKIYAGNLSDEITQEDLYDTFANYGEIVSIELITDQDSGRLKGFGFVGMLTLVDAETAIRNLNNSELKERTIKVSQAYPRGGDSRGDRDEECNFK